MSPAEELRAAAARMRELAEKATPGPWWTHQTPAGTPAVRAGGSLSGSGRQVAYFRNIHAGQEGTRNAEYVAAWHPAVVLAVAELLDVFADQHAEAEAAHWQVEHHQTAALVPAVRAVARAFLGGTS